MKPRKVSASTRGIGEGVSNKGYLDDFGFGKKKYLIFSKYDLTILVLETYKQYETPEVPISNGNGVSKMEMQGKVEEKRKK